MGDRREAWALVRELRNPIPPPGLTVIGRVSPSAVLGLSDRVPISRPPRKRPRSAMELRMMHSVRQGCLTETAAQVRAPGASPVTPMLCARARGLAPATLRSPVTPRRQYHGRGAAIDNHGLLATYGQGSQNGALRIRRANCGFLSGPHECLYERDNCTSGVGERDRLEVDRRVG